VSKGNTVLATQFASLEQQQQTATFGMWVFLMTELLLFGALFTAYAVNRFRYPDAFALASHDLEAGTGAINTAVLIGSSLMMALAVNGARTDRRKRLLGGLTGTILLGMVFMGLKVLEYYHHYQHHEFPGLSFIYTGPNPDAARIFFFLYFVMTGVHAVHLIVGIGLVTIVLVQSYRCKYTSRYYTPVEMSGLYWHFVDVIWIFLFPLFYLIDLHR
jgi:cytochrome c oxidase subunit 3